MSSDQFITYLSETYPERNDLTWDYFFDQICNITKTTIKSISENIENKINSFELYGFDFVIDKDFNCWLLEVNMSPACAERTPWLTEMLDDMANGMLQFIEKKVVKLGSFSAPIKVEEEKP
mmetsp:Transcript_9650/g.9327  ORF Transcript_9650/g.9327 Transcript_9650/m.9327 type:complete len:121 (-) Transcript_9650:1117-1479(-)